jgi:hypothetical protein
MRLSLVIPAHNRKEASTAPNIEAPGAALAAGSIPFEIVAVDDGNSGATAVQVRRPAARHAAGRLVENHGCHGFAGRMVIPLKAMVRGFSGWKNISPAANYSRHHLRQPDALISDAANTATADV